MVTAATFYNMLHYFNLTVDIRNICVFLAPLFSSFTTIVTYHLTKELSNSGAGLVAAAFMSVVPGYISRSVAGKFSDCMLFHLYDQDIFCLQLSEMGMDSESGYIFRIRI